MNVLFRPYRPEDAVAFAEIHYDAVHNLAKKHYTQDILDDWSSAIDEKRIEQIQESAAQEIRIMAEVDGVLAGFGCLIPENSELRACYVHSRYAGKGVGRKILIELEKIALARGLKELRMDSSLNAKNFYERNGYEVLEKTMHSSRQSGTLIECYKMRKNLSLPDKKI